MKDEDIKLPEMVNLTFRHDWHNAIEEYARQAVRMNMPQPKPSDPEPFDLARAMAGEPIVTRNGRKARFVAHVPEAKHYKVAAFVNGTECSTNFDESGHLYDKNHEHDFDLFMAPKPKRTVWVNVWPKINNNLAATAYDSKSEAIYIADENDGCKYLAIAHPIEIDATE